MQTEPGRVIGSREALLHSPPLAARMAAAAREAAGDTNPKQGRCRMVVGGQLRKMRARVRARTALAWTAVWFVVGQLLTIAWLEQKQPEFYDPKYGCRLKQLRARLGWEPEAPLLVVLGSSRAEQGFRPGFLSAS